MDLNTDTLRQPTCHEELGAAMEIFLRDRLRAAAAGAALSLPRRLCFKLYQCLGDGRSASALGDDLRLFAAEPRAAGDGFVAVFECAPDSDAHDREPRPAFAELLNAHLTLLDRHELGIDARAALRDRDEEHLQLDILGRRFRLIVMHADAERLTRVMPCPVLAFLPL